jgi:hypothetical protein
VIERACLLDKRVLLIHNKRTKKLCISLTH